MSVEQTMLKTSMQACTQRIANRNKFSHHYPDESQSRLERINLAIEESRFVISTFESIASYLGRKGFV